MAGLSLCVLVLAGLAVWRVADSPYVAPAGPDPAAAGEAEPGLASAALQRLQQAIASGDAAAAAALAPGDDAAAAERLRAVVDNADALRLTGVTLRYVEQASAVDAAGTWSAAVEVTWRLRGFDPAPARTEVAFTLRAEPDRVALVSAGGGGLRTPLWLAEPLRVARTPDTLVMVAGDAAELREYAALARRAVPVVARVVPADRPRLVVEVPAGADQLDALLDVPAGTYAGVAAVTAPVDGRDEPGGPLHVFVNPEEMSGLRPTGAQVVMSHEATHAVTDAPTSRAPLWLVEGFADYVALRDVDLPLATTAAQAIAQVRREGLPAALPGTSDFDVAQTHLGATYESAWLACRFVAERAGQQALVRLYEATSRGEDLGTTLRRVSGLSVESLTQDWRRELRALADAPG
ncbi:basic secretory family protein [Nocardioides sp. P86]|uniref:basic secretory family protein n=1 Tax=Nocardioides sp. P86 TaxID=2939569 RepID=UPI00203C725A|nr:basic secretory family protein [Nocardioides sp. P86]MCM3514094.1 basic secretory family protein [Nocardioides sp. P86]